MSGNRPAPVSSSLRLGSDGRRTSARSGQCALDGLHGHLGFQTGWVILTGSGHWLSFIFNAAHHLRKGLSVSNFWGPLQAQKAGLKSQLQDLVAELHEYETLKTAGPKIFELD